MSKFYHVIREGDSKWIKSPNNGGECCTTQEDTVEALNKLIQERDALQARVKRLEEIGDQMAAWLNCERNLGNDTYTAHLWKQAKEAKP